MIPFHGSKTSFFEGLLKASRKLELEYEWSSAHSSESAKGVRTTVAHFLENYAESNRIDIQTALNAYMDFNRSYVNDLQTFATNGKYPLEINPQVREMSRTTYDLALILSILVMPHRCSIMEEILKTSISGKPLVIGVGSGVELGFIPTSDSGDAYDLYINPFARQAFSQWQFHEEIYRPLEQRYGVVYAIELLEHLADPYAFAADCHVSLLPGGWFVTTTATNVPQFDHRYNFVSDEDFERKLQAMGFKMESKRTIPHEYPLMNIRAAKSCQARNVFYAFRKEG